MNSRWADDEALLTRAYLTAFGAKVDETALEALALRIHRRSRELGQAQQTREDIALAREYAARLRGPARLSGQVLNSMGSALLAIGDLHQAEVTLREALAVRMAASGPRHVDVGFTLSNLALVVSGTAEREMLVLRALGIFETELGPAHPHSAVIRIVASVSLTGSAHGRRGARARLLGARAVRRRPRGPARDVPGPPRPAPRRGGRAGGGSLGLARSGGAGRGG